MIKCNNCGSENEPNQGKCVICGHFLFFLMKIVLTGDPGVGKTEFREKFLGRGFQSKYMMTIGADFALQSMVIDERPIKFQIWDLASQQRFSAGRSVYYLGALGGIVLFDVTKKESFENIPYWIKEIWTNNGKGTIPLVLVGNNVNLRNQYPDAISNETAEKYVKKLSKQTIPHGFNISYIPASVKSGLNITQAFEELGRTYFQYLDWHRQRYEN
ncbi:MAG: GTP-binding protein [Candidatus Hodarchaeales archaeon]|jgi:small GTP-binding protein